MGSGAPADGPRWVLAVDHGTTSTVGATAEVDPVDGWVRVGVVEVGGTAAVPSAVLSHPDGTVLAGLPALEVGRDRPDAVVRRARSHLAAGAAREVLTTVPRPTTASDVATALVAAFLHAECARRRDAPAALLLLHPASWGGGPREALLEAGRDALLAAGLSRTPAVAVPGPEGLVHRLGGDEPVVVADLGGGGTDLALVADGRVRAARSVPLGAEVLDDALAGLVLDRARPELASRIRHEDGGERTWFALRTQVRTAKEALASAATVDVPLPAHPPVRLGHEDLTRLLAPGLEQVVDGVRSLLGEAPAGPAPRLLVRGGLAEAPRVREWLARHTGLAPVAGDPGVLAPHGPVSGAAARAAAHGWETAARES